MCRRGIASLAVDADRQYLAVAGGQPQDDRFQRAAEILSSLRMDSGSVRDHRDRAEAIGAAKSRSQYGKLANTRRELGSFRGWKKYISWSAGIRFQET